MNKKKMCVLVLVIAAVLLLAAFLGRGNTLYDDPESMAEGALTCIYGWKDMDMLMSLTPYREGSEIYDIAYRYFQTMMRDSGWVDSYRNMGDVDLNKADKAYFEEMKNELEDYGITGIKTIKRFIYQYDSNSEISVYVAKIGGNWYTVAAE